MNNITGSKLDAPPIYCTGLHRLSTRFFMSLLNVTYLYPFSSSIHRPLTISISKPSLFNESTLFLIFSGRIRPDSPRMVSFSSLVSTAASPVSSIRRCECDSGDNRRRGYDSSTAGLFTRNSNPALFVENFRFGE